MVVPPLLEPEIGVQFRRRPSRSEINRPPLDRGEAHPPHGPRGGLLTSDLEYPRSPTVNFSFQIKRIRVRLLNLFAVVLWFELVRLTFQALLTDWRAVGLTAGMGEVWRRRAGVSVARMMPNMLTFPFHIVRS